MRTHELVCNFLYGGLLGTYTQEVNKFSKRLKGMTTLIEVSITPGSGTRKSHLESIFQFEREPIIRDGIYDLSFREGINLSKFLIANCSLEVHWSIHSTIFLT